jgi:hypothetical protein
MLTCNNYFMAGAVAIVGQPATLPVLVLIVPIFYRPAMPIKPQQWTVSKLAHSKKLILPQS